MSSGGVTEEAAAIRLASDLTALTTGAAVVTDRHSIIWIRGADAVSFLDALVSQSVASTDPGAVSRSLLLTPQGKMRAFLWILGGTEDEVGLVTQSSTETLVVEDLTRFRFRVDATIEVDSRPVATLVGPGAEAALLASEVPRPGAGWLATEGGLVATVPFTSGELPRFVVAGDAVAALSAAVVPAGELAYEAVRISMGEPLGEVDFDDGTISHELGPVDVAVDFTKGCYLGQELVARIDARGRVNRHLRGLVVGANVRPPEGAEIVGEGGASVGSVGSVAESLELRAPVGLALVRREVSPGSAVEVRWEDGAVPAEVRELPLVGNT